MPTTPSTYRLISLLQVPLSLLELAPLAIGCICVTFFNITKQRERCPLPLDDDFYTTEVKNPF
jgi:hypothetical protein